MDSDHQCGGQFSTTIQAISNYATILYFVLAVLLIQWEFRKAFLLVLVACLALKLISFISMLIHYNQDWNGCYIRRGQITNFILGDAFWVILMLFYLVMLQKLQLLFIQKLQCRTMRLKILFS